MAIVRLIHRAAVAAAFVVVVGACGQKGPLYLPGDPSRIRTEVPEIGEGEERQEEDESRERGPDRIE